MSRRVLIVDDISALRDGLKSITSEILPNWVIDEAPNKTEAFHLLNTTHYDIVLTDLMLEEGNTNNHQGMEVAKLAREKNKLCSIGIVTNHLSKFLTRNQLSQYYQYNFEYFDRNIIPFEGFVSLLKNYLIRFDHDQNEMIQLSDIWKPKKYEKCSYWILLTSGIDKKYQMELAEELIK